MQMFNRLKCLCVAVTQLEIGNNSASQHGSYPPSMPPYYNLVVNCFVCEAV